MVKLAVVLVGNSAVTSGKMAPSQILLSLLPCSDTVRMVASCSAS